MPQITRVLEFDAGHRVLGHEGKCRHLHGHRYRAEITIRAPRLDPLGRVVDFSVIKEKVGGWIDRHWDHNMILHPGDPLAVEVGLCGREPYLMPGGNPTAENLAELLYHTSQKLLPTPLGVVRVRLYETPNSYADYGGEI